MEEVFITDDPEIYLNAVHKNKLLFAEGYFRESSFISGEQLASFNSEQLGLEDEANRLMLEQFDADLKRFTDSDLNFRSNKFIAGLPYNEKMHSLLFKFYKSFVLRKYILELGVERLFRAFPSFDPVLLLNLSENFITAKDFAYPVKSADYRDSYGKQQNKLWLRQLYYFARRYLLPSKALPQADIAIFIVDIPNEVDLFAKFAELIKERTDLSVCFVMMESGNAKEKKAEVSQYHAVNIHSTYLHWHKAFMPVNYNGFYRFCEKINPSFSIFRKARLSETEDPKYAFMNRVIDRLQPRLCIYINNQEEGRMMSNICRYRHIPSLYIDYAFFFDTYTTERRIRYDIRACISQVTVQNWIKHKDPTPKFEITGFCRIDSWHSRKKFKADLPKLFDNDHRTIFFASTWAPNPYSPLLSEKVKITEQLSEACHRNGWNLIIKKHPSEFDNAVEEIIGKNNYANQRVIEHAEMPLFNCIAYADFVCTQNSSVFIEALYLNKPFAYLTIYEENAWANMSYFAKEEKVGKFNRIRDFEAYIKMYESEPNYKKLQQELLGLQEKFLFKTDGCSSARLLELAERMMAEKKKVQ